MQNMFQKSKITRITRTSAVLSLILMTAACSPDQSENFFQSVIRFPGRTVDKTGDFWDKHVKGVPPNWQKNLELGSPRRPVLNPGGASEGLSAEEYFEQRKLGRPASQFPDLAKRPMSSPVSNAPMFESSPPQMMQEAPVSYMPQQPTQYVPPPSFAPVDTGVKYTPLLPLPTSFEDEGASKGYVPDARSNVRAVEPIPPWEKNKDYLGTSGTGEQSSNVSSGVKNKPSPFTSNHSKKVSSDSDDTGGAINPYDTNSFEKGFNPPSYDQVNQMGEDAFAPLENKYMRVFEPMAAEYYVDGVETVEDLEAASEEGENIGDEPLDLKKKN
jgi:hypothetical protein